MTTDYEQVVLGNQKKFHPWFAASVTIRQYHRADEPLDDDRLTPLTAGSCTKLIAENAGVVIWIVVLGGPA